MTQSFIQEDITTGDNYTVVSTTDNTTLTVSDDYFILTMAIKELTREIKALKLALRSK